MELALSLGEAPKSFSLLDNTTKLPANKDPVGFCIALGGGGGGFGGKSSSEDRRYDEERRGSSDPPVQLELLPSTPVLRSQPSSHLRIPWLTDART